MKHMKRIDDRPFLVTLGLICLVVIMVCGLVMEYGWFGYSAPLLTVTPVTVTDGSGLTNSQEQTKINVNTATVSILDTLPKVGPTLAQRIVDYREENGPFTKPEELKNVAGIGDKVLEAILPYITIQ